MKRRITVLLKLVSTCKLLRNMIWKLNQLCTNVTLVTGAVYRDVTFSDRFHTKRLLDSFLIHCDIEIFTLSVLNIIVFFVKIAHLKIYVLFFYKSSRSQIFMI